MQNGREADSKRLAATNEITTVTAEMQSCRNNLNAAEVRLLPCSLYLGVLTGPRSA